MLDTHELAWAAGFYDGEGCTSKTGGKKRMTPGAPRMSVTQYTLEPLERFQKALLGIGAIRDYTHRERGYVWETTNKADAQAAIALLWKYLSTPKREQALIRWQEYRDKIPLRPSNRKAASHGTAGMYSNHGCRCTECTKANTIACRTRKQEATVT